MLNIKTHNLKLEEIFCYGKMGCIEDLKPDDWVLLENLVDLEFDNYTHNDQVTDDQNEIAEDNYNMGLRDGKDSHEENLRLVKILKENGIEY